MTIFNTFTVLIVSGIFSFHVMAQQSEPNTSDKTNENNNDVIELDEVEVWSEPFAQKMGTQKLNSETIRKLPTANGSISELLKRNPNVRFSSTASTSETQGEIAPENISIHGERFYNNSWMLDGMSNNDNVNPGSNNGSLSVIDAQSPFLLPDGGTQSFWIDADLIDSVDVYDSNISARFGQFTGGVIDAKLIDPDTEKASGSVAYRVTRDEWTQFHFENDTRKASFEKAATVYDQPQFLKEKYAITVNQPLSESAAILFSYNRAESTIPFHHTRLVPDRWEDQRRLAETYLLKGLYETENGDTWKLTLLHAPHESRYFFANVKDGGYRIQGGGTRINLDWRHLFTAGVVTSYIGYRESNNDVEYDKQRSFSWELSPSIDWRSTGSVANEGGYGQSVTRKDVLTIKQDYELDPFNAVGLEHKLAFGWKADIAEAEYERVTPAYIYVSTGQLIPDRCDIADLTCISGEQAAVNAVVYPESITLVSNNHYVIYAENQIKWGGAEVTTGLRADYDEFQGNLDIAPRITASYNLFDDKSTTVFGGVNRYYADSLLTYALSEKTGTAISYRRTDYDEGWIPLGEGNIGGRYTVNELNTPYSDEFNVGVSQRIGNTRWTLKWVQRNGQQQFEKQVELDANNRKTYRLTNNGENRSDSITLSGKLLKPIEWQAVTLDIDVGANYIDSRSNFTSYDPDPSREFSDIYRFYADGYVMTFDELMTRNDFNSPWTLFTTFDVEFSSIGLNWSQTYRYTSAYSQYTHSGENYVCTATNASCNGFVGSADIYKKERYSNRFNADWRLLYNIDLEGDVAELSLDVLNVFNSKSEGQSITPGESVVTYKSGRQFWLGVKYRW